jgi:hypothetical protein
MKMKKTLLLTAALACSGAAQAEIYICEVETVQLNFPRGEPIEIDYRLRAGDGASIYIDTSRGFREISRSAGEEYPFKGKCERLSYLGVVECISSLNASYHHLGISEFDGLLYFLETNLTSYRFGQMRSGSCLKI